jgi:putative acetyltransferase
MPRGAGSIAPARTPADLAAARRLFREYQREIGVDLGFQGFGAELAGLPGEYRPPDGGLWIARSAGRLVGCGALRPFAPGVGEVKRLFVRPGARGAGWGRRIATTIVRRARAAGYRALVLDTLASMDVARSLYRALGFHEIPPYRYNPLAGARYYRLDLARRRAPRRGRGTAK